MKKLVFYAVFLFIGLNIMMGYFIAFCASPTGFVYRSNTVGDFYGFPAFLRLSDTRFFFFNCGIFIFLGGLILFIRESLKRRKTN